MPRSYFRRRAWLITVPALVAASLTVHTQNSRLPDEPRRRLVSEAALPGIDRGLSRQDPPRPLAAPSPMTAGGDEPELVVREGEPYVRGSVIVKFKGGASTNSVNATLRAVSGTSATRPAYADFDLMSVPADSDPEAVAAALRARGDVEYAQPRYVNHALFKPNDQYYDLQWNLSALEMERAWDIQPGASNAITVAVLDSGVAYRNIVVQYQGRAFQMEQNGPVFPALGLVNVPFAAAPDLGDASRFVAPFDFVWNDALPVDLDGHGTHVAGTIGQATNNGLGVAGMAFNVRLMPVKVISGAWDFIFGSPNAGTDDVVARGVRYAVDNGAKVINMSIGRDGGGSAPVIEDALRYAVSRGVFVAVAAGNSREEGNEVSRPADVAPAIDGVVAVGAVGRDLSIAYYSTAKPYVELSAPGGDLRRFGGEGGILQQTYDFDLLETYERGPTRYTAPRADAFRYVYFQGTSMATPHVAGFAALLMQQGITSPAAIEAAMKQFATDKGPTGQDVEYGVGMINPRATLRGLGLAR